MKTRGNRGWSSKRQGDCKQENRGGQICQGVPGLQGQSIRQQLEALGSVLSSTSFKCEVKPLEGFLNQICLRLPG